MPKHRLRCFFIIKLKFKKEAEWSRRLFCLDFRYAKIRIIRLICNIFGLIYIKKKHRFYPTGSIIDRLVDFASSVPDFRRTDKGNHRHRLRDIIMLMVLGRASGFVGRADIIAFGKHNIKKFRKMGMLKNGVPSEATLCRVDSGINDCAMADRMQELV